MATPVIKHTWTSSIKNDSGSAVVADPPLVLTGNDESNIAAQVAAGETLHIANLDIQKANIVSMFLTCDQQVTVATNESTPSSPPLGNTFTVPAKKSISWNNTQVVANPITKNITDIYVTNSGATVANFRAGFLLNN